MTFEKETRARKQAEPLRYAISTALKRFRGRILKRYVGKTPWAEFDRLVTRALDAPRPNL